MSRDNVQARRIMKMQNVCCFLLGLLIFGAVGPGLTVADPADRTITAPGDPLNGRPYWEVLARCAGVQAALSVAAIADEIVRAGDPKRKDREATWAKFHGNRDTLEDTGLLFLRSAGRFLIEDRHVSNEQAKAIYNQQSAQGDALKLEAAVPQANACIGAYQLCQSQYPKVCGSKLP